MKYYFFLPFFILLTLFSCKPTTLPYLGNTVIENGKPKYHVIRDFTYINQDSVQVSNKDLSAYIYIADFFFTSCPSICPKVMKEMLKIHEAFKGDDRVRLVSFTIDPKRDNAETVSYTHLDVYKRQVIRLFVRTRQTLSFGTKWLQVIPFTFI